MNSRVDLLGNVTYLRCEVRNGRFELQYPTIDCCDFLHTRAGWNDELDYLRKTSVKS